MSLFPQSSSSSSPPSSPLLQSARISEDAASTAAPTNMVMTNNNKKNNKVALEEQQQKVPTTMKEALQVFFLSGDCGPSWVILMIGILISLRLQLAFTTTTAATTVAAHPSLGLFLEGMVFVSTIVVWSIQEHVLHQRILHSSTMDWIGKEIHQRHHEKPYYHISLDPAPLLIGWMLTAYIIFQWIFSRFPSSSLPLAITATIGYSCAGLFYEWAHFIVHTKVPIQKYNKFWKRVKENHMRHHLISDQYWYAFSYPSMDDWFGTNPNVRDIKQQQEEGKKLNQPPQKDTAQNGFSTS